MSEISGPSTGGIPADQAARTAAEEHQARWERRVRISAARGLVLVHQRTGWPISDEVVALAAEDW